MDVCAYHCQQRIEKAAKFLILMQGDTYANDHRSDIYLEDLKDEEVKTIIQGIASKIDFWATTILYHQSILSNEKMVKEIIGICEKLIVLIESRMPKETTPPTSCMTNFTL
jgi:HEPN domain-containing protein